MLCSCFSRPVLRMFSINLLCRIHSLSLSLEVCPPFAFVLIVLFLCRATPFPDADNASVAVQSREEFNTLIAPMGLDKVDEGAEAPESDQPSHFMDVSDRRDRSYKVHNAIDWSKVRRREASLLKEVSRSSERSMPDHEIG